MTDSEYWERHAKRYDKATRFLSRPNARMLALTVDAVRGRQRVLEVAAGTGLVTGAIAEVTGEVIAADYAHSMVDKLKARVVERGLTNVSCAQADLYALDYPDASFDAVVAANVLHLVPDLTGALASMQRVLRPGGLLVVPTYCHKQTVVSSLLSRVFALTGFPGKRRFTLSSLRNAIEDAELEVRHTELIRGPIPVGYIDASIRC